MLHILTRPGDPLPAAAMSASSPAPGAPPIRIVDLTPAPPDYEALLRAIFQADSIAVW